jgi:predicted CoA-substrate-specific enzyme activase
VSVGCEDNTNKLDTTRVVFTILFAGVDIGSTTSKCVLIDETKRMISFQIIPTSFDRNASGEEVLRKALEESGLTLDEVVSVVSTGYGRKAFKRANKNIPEITAHAVGTQMLFPNVRTIIDIGGQDSKVIEIDERGMVIRFAMNDKCAAGTGRFFEVLSERLLNVEMDDLSPMILQAKNPCSISSMCTIFAESEIISYLSQGVAKEDIVAGMGASIVRRIVSMGRSSQITFPEPIVFSGGVAKNEGIRREFERMLEKPVTALKLPQSTAAIGAALEALKIFKKKESGDNCV